MRQPRQLSMDVAALPGKSRKEVAQELFEDLLMRMNDTDICRMRERQAVNTLYAFMFGDEAPAYVPTWTREAQAG